MKDHSLIRCGRRLGRALVFRRVNPEETALMRIPLLIAVLMVSILMTGVSRGASAQSASCGLRPLPELGCRIGRCVNGAWEQICDANPALSCGLRPLPELGCRVGRCVDGAWEQICDRNPSLSCGLKPLPELGCRIGRCVDGAWEQICN